MLKFLTILKVGMKAIARNKMRSILTALGIIIGVACVIAMIGVGAGLAGRDPGADLGARHELPDDLPGHRDAVGRPHLHRPVDDHRGRRRGGARPSARRSPT